jgi:LacI family transcriptional regulator
MPVVLDVFYGDIIRGFQAEAQRLGYQVLLHMYDSAADTPALLKESLPEEARGLVVANDGDIRPDVITQMEELTLPLVLIENQAPDHRLDCVLGDNFEAGYTVTKHLLDLGHRSLAILRGPTKYSSLVDRLRGSLAAVAEAGLQVPTELMPQPVSGHPKKGYLQMREVLRSSHRPTAVVAVSDKTAFPMTSLSPASTTSTKALTPIPPSRPSTWRATKWASSPCANCTPVWPPNASPPPRSSSTEN